MTNLYLKHYASTKKAFNNLRKYVNKVFIDSSVILVALEAESLFEKAVWTSFKRTNSKKKKKKKLTDIGTLKKLA